MKLELKIAGLLARHSARKFTINEIAKSLKEHYSFVHRIIGRLTKDRVIIKEKAGNAYLCSINFASEKATALLQLNEIEKKVEFYNMHKEARLILEEFVKSAVQANADSIVLFGSYAREAATKESDIDILLISESRKRIDKITKEIYAKYGKEINVIAMSSSNFKKQKDKALIKEIIRDHIILQGVAEFITLVSA